MKKSDLNKLRKRLPYGYRTKAVAMLAKAGRNVTRQSISEALDNGSPIATIEILCTIAEEHEAEMARLAARVRGERIPA